MIYSHEKSAAAREIFGPREQVRTAPQILGEELTSAALDMSSHPWVSDTLGPKERALILFSLDASASQLEPSRLPQRIADARAEGATDREIIGVLHLTTLMACHSVAVGGSILYDVLLERGAMTDVDSLTDEQEEAIRHYEEDGAAPRTISKKLRALMLTDLEHFNDTQSYINLAYANTEVIGARFAHLVCLAFDAAPSHLYEPGIRIHIKEALDNGATIPEINEVIQLASLRGWRSMSAGLEALTKDASAESAF